MAKTTSNVWRVLNDLCNDYLAPARGTAARRPTDWCARSFVPGVGEAVEVAHILAALADLGVHHGLANELLLEVLDTVGADLRLERRLVAPLVELDPVDVLEEGVPLHVVAASRAAPQALLGVALEQAREEGLGDRRDVAGVGQVTRADALEKLHAVLGVEGREAGEHLVGEGADGVPIDAPAVALLVDDLGCQVLGRPAHRLRRDVVHDALLAETEVRHLDVTVTIQKQVLRLEIAVDDAEAVEVCYGRGRLRRVEACAALGEAASAAEVVEELATIAEFHDHVELLRRLEGVVQVHYEGVGHGLQDASLGLRVLDLVPLDDVFLAEHLHGVDLLSTHVPHEHDLAVGALAQHLDEL
eukprot:CAMPEP_0203985106 /NCGR_PEP_ID=MMETSP0360-20130528/5105_1 /ASSEMBLY_ACC=CAM_ASM_000342 /TAXON_ID=268821 /ORGANISM="Scrippsiella Hangoei, Strain SHTV-5" /LENGTH=357 /DNA_ID=CAMNT_0050924347 /DNA_START=244 /DNA_END=1313 /DNA_ORIENTATION=+